MIRPLKMTHYLIIPKLTKSFIVVYECSLSSWNHTTQLKIFYHKDLDKRNRNDIFVFKNDSWKHHIGPSRIFYRIDE